ncbi:MAG: hypothetical protein OEY14_12845, partial [Myxococcales bacterium]|nr:hypothetical protein [Myxococcales bacterium]
MRRSSRSLLLLLALALLAHGCGGDETGMPDGGPDDGSLDASPDGADADAGPTSCMSVTTITGASVTGPFPDGIAGDTDLAVENGLVRVVFNAVDHDPELAASGGNIVDFHFLGEDDHFRELSQLASPGQAFQVRYTALEVATETLDTVIVRATGHVSPQPDEGGFPLTPDPGAGLAVVTEYELRCGDPRVRLSTTITNTTANVYAVSNGFSVMDFLVWG